MLSKQLAIKAIALSMAWSCAITPAWADEEPMTRHEKMLNDYNNDYSCGQIVPMGAVEPADYLAEDSLQGLSIEGEALPLILGDSMDLGGGTLVYQQQGETWQARIIRMGTSITQVYTNSDRSAYWIFFMHTSEAPGPIEYLHLTQESALCGELISPDDLNQPTWKMEYADIIAFNISDAGKGVVLATATLYEDSENPKKQWYQYITEDNGETWSKAQTIPKPSDTPAGIWEQVEISEPDPVLIRSLIAQ